MEKFSINLEKLKSNLKSTINYIEASHDGQPIEYLITPDQSQGSLTVSRIPDVLKVRQIGIDSYPYRPLYSVDFNYMKIVDKIRKQANDNGENVSDAAIQSLANEKIDTLKRKMPFRITIVRDTDDKEKLSISSIEDKNGWSFPIAVLKSTSKSIGIDDHIA